MAMEIKPYWQKKMTRAVESWVNKIAELLSDGRVRTVRNITYHYFPKLHGKALDRAYHNIIKYVVRGRANPQGAVPILWTSIRESRTRLQGGPGFDDPKEFIRYYEGKDLSAEYSRDKTPAHKCHFEVWSEKDTVAPEFERICSKYDVPSLATRGQLTWNAKKKAADRLGRDSIILYFGDNDDKGHEIYDVIKRDLKFLGCHAKITWCGITGIQQSKYGLTEECRLDGPDLNVLEEIIEQEIKRHIDTVKYNAILDQESKDIKSLKALKIYIRVV